jgi:hypothetical protein
MSILKLKRRLNKVLRALRLKPAIAPRKRASSVSKGTAEVL